MNEELKEQEIQQLERELRSFGDPYASPEPDPRYFANFRARVMERVAQEPASVGVMQRISSFFFGSPWRLAMSGGGVVAAALLYFGLQSSPEHPIVAEEIRTPAPQESVAPMPENIPAPVEPQQIANTPKPVELVKNEQPQPVGQVVPVTPAPKQNVVESPAPVSGNIADASAEFDKMDELSVSDDTEPVSYDRLSMAELEAILQTLETEPLTIQ